MRPFLLCPLAGGRRQGCWGAVGRPRDWRPRQEAASSPESPLAGALAATAASLFSRRAVSNGGRGQGVPLQRGTCQIKAAGACAQPERTCCTVFLCGRGCRRGILQPPGQRAFWAKGPAPASLSQQAVQPEERCPFQGTRGTGASEHSFSASKHHSVGRDKQSPVAGHSTLSEQVHTGKRKRWA